MTYEGLVPKVTKSMLQKDRDAVQPHVRAFVDRAVKFMPCAACDGTRLNGGARSTKIAGASIADAAAMQITDLAAWVRGVDDPSVGPLLQTLQQTLDSFVDIGLGYLSLDRASGTLSGGEAQRTKMIRHLGSALTDTTYVFDEPTTGLASLEPRDLHGHPRRHPQGLREGERGEAGALQRELRGRVPRVPRPRRDHHEPRLHAERRDPLRAVRGDRLQRRRA